MALIDTETWISQYWDKVEQNYPDIDFPHFMEICKSPFKYVRYAMGHSILPTIMIKYLGKLRVFPVTIRRMIAHNDKRASFGDITIDEWECRKSSLEKKLYMIENPEPRKKRQPTRQIIFIDEKNSNNNSSHL